MRPLRVGIVILAFVLAYCGFVVWRLLRLPTPPVAYTTPCATKVGAVKTDLCRLAGAEAAFYRTTGHYVPETELRSNGDYTLPPTTRWPYHRRIDVPIPDKFVIVASAYGPLEKQPPALVIDTNLQVCTVKSNIPQFSRKLDSPSQHWGESVDYDCEKCDDDQ